MYLLNDCVFVMFIHVIVLNESYLRLLETFDITFAILQKCSNALAELESHHARVSPLTADVSMFRNLFLFLLLFLFWEVDSPPQIRFAG
jgi:hypothetical protein